MSFSNLCKVVPVDAKAPTTINTPVDMANPKCSCHCGCNNVVTFSGGDLLPIRQSQPQPSHLLPLEEIDERIEHVKAIQSIIRSCCRPGSKDFCLRAEHVAAIMTIPLPVFGPNELISTDIDNFEMKRRPAKAIKDLRHLRRRHRATFFSGQLSQPSIECPSTISHGSTRMDIDETTSFEVKSEPKLRLQVIEPSSLTGSESEYTDELEATELLTIDKHNMDFAEQIRMHTTSHHLLGIILKIISAERSN
ncbi:hypothetical protein FCIRC_2751 [Fusarium circinatum]|uniref:Uncharacterized protein n=1 Tax=Fusarium circinatum TaxID=48490 RepID=A0A8H5X489_FUSCI|nr:hypothetical protein FCIRC_2751 [Fusarium circinatum]